MSGLLDKIYEDGKYTARKREEKNKEMEKKKEKEKKRLESEKSREKKARNKKKGKKLTTNEKIVYSCLAVVVVPFIQLFFIYHQCSWLDIILKSTKNSKYLKEHLPDGEGLPYGLGEQGSGIACGEIKQIYKENLIDRGKPSGAQKGGGKKKRYKQKGGSNEGKHFLDSTKYGIPYNLTQNYNFLLNGIGEYFKTFWQYQRMALKMLLETLNESIFKDHTEPTSLGEQFYDVLKLVVVLPFVNILVIIGQTIMSTVLLFGAAFNNQTFLIIPLFIFALCCIFWGWIGGYFWPWGVFSLYLTFFIINPTPGKLENFRNYGKKYKWLWCFSIAIMWAISIGTIWTWHKNSMIFIGIIWGLLGLGMLGISNLV